MNTASVLDSCRRWTMPNHNPERRNPHRLAREAERAQQVAASLAQIADDVATTQTCEHIFDCDAVATHRHPHPVIDGRAGTNGQYRCDKHRCRDCVPIYAQRVVGIDEAHGDDVGCKVTAMQLPDGTLVIESVEYSRGLAPDAGTDELDALDLEGASMLMHDFIRPMGVQS